VNAVAMSPDKHYVVSGSWDATVRLWDVSTKAEVRVLYSNPGHHIPHRLVFSPDGKSVMGCGLFGVGLWSVPDGKTLALFQPPGTGEFECAGFTPNGRQAVTISLDRVIRIWALPTTEKSDEK
jgi:WD40 repeat protein